MSDVMHIPSDSWITLTRYSFINTTIFTGIIILLLIFITNKIKFLPKINIVFTYLFILIIGIRLLTPFEFRFTRGISSYHVMHKIKEITNTTVIPIGTDSSISVLNVLCFIWILGAVISLSKYFAGYYFLCKNANRIPPCDNDRINNVLNTLKNKYNFNFNTRVVVFSGFDSPSEFGLLNQTIFLNTDNYNESELYFILLHELEHFHNKSNYINVFMNIVCCVYWWNPILKLFKDHVDELIETYVDDFVSSELDRNEKYNYMKCIFDIYKSEGNLSKSNTPTESIIGIGRKNKLLNRFKVMAENKKINTSICILLLLIMSFYMFCSGRYVVQNAEEPPKEDMSWTYSDFTPENSYIKKENGKHTKNFM